MRWILYREMIWETKNEILFIDINLKNRVKCNMVRFHAYECDIGGA